MISLFSGILGLAAGSFLNVCSMRFDPAWALPAARLFGGRSRCPQCRHTLRWYELLPILSFIIQSGRCRACRATLTFQYPFVELLVAGLFAALAIHLQSLFGFAHLASFGAPWWLFFVKLALWLIVAWILVLVALIDLKHFIIPDGLTGALAVLGVLWSIILFFEPSPAPPHSFLGFYAIPFGLFDSLITGRLAAALFGLLFFGGIVFFSRGRGMGVGDVKLMMALGLLFGWPDILLIAMLSFIIGSLIALPLLFMRRLTLRARVPFGPCIVLASFITLFFGFRILEGYFMLFNG